MTKERFGKGMPYDQDKGRPTLYDQDADLSFLNDAIAPEPVRQFRVISGEKDERETVRAILSGRNEHIEPDEVYEDEDSSGFDADIDDYEEAETDRRTLSRGEKVAIGLGGLVVSYFLTNRFQTPAENLGLLWDWLKSNT